MTRHFLRDDDLSPREQRDVLELALAFRDDRFIRTPLTGPRAVAVIFDKPTLRTQVSFTAGIAELGGFPLSVDGNLAKIGERESIADTARVLGRRVCTCASGRPSASCRIRRSSPTRQRSPLPPVAPCRSRTTSPRP